MEQWYITNIGTDRRRKQSPIVDSVTKFLMDIGASEVLYPLIVGENGKKEPFHEGYVYIHADPEKFNSKEAVAHPQIYSVDGVPDSDIVDMRGKVDELNRNGLPSKPRYDATVNVGPGEVLEVKVQGKAGDGRVVVAHTLLGDTTYGAYHPSSVTMKPTGAS